MIMLTVVPIIIIVLIANGSSHNRAMNSHLNLIQNTLKNQAEDINFIFEDIISNSKQIVSTDYIKEYTELSNKDNFDINTGYLYAEKIDMRLDNLLNHSNSLQKAMLINNSGMIIASTDDSDVGKAMSNYKALFSLALDNNGFSSFYVSSESGNSSPLFIVSKSIYSSNNERQGILYQLYNTNYLQKFMNSLKIDKYSRVAVMDDSGNILEYPYKVIKSYSENANFAPANDNIKQILESDLETAQNTMIECGGSSQPSLFYNAKISNSNWTLISITNKNNLSSELKRDGNSLKTAAVLLVILVCAAAITFVIIFTKPIDEIITYFLKKQKGDHSISCNVKSHDEFQSIGEAFNKMFDDIFESEQRYRTIVEMTNNIIFEINFKKQTVYISKNFNKKFSFRPADDSLKESFFYKLRIHKDDKDRYNSDLAKILGDCNFWQGDYRIKNIYGDFGWVMIKGTKFFDSNELPSKIVGVIVDIDREKKSEMHLLQRASYDALTQLYNRETFLKSLSNEIEVSTMKKTLDALMFIDLDDFKHFNDEYGHACGDEVLKFVADTLKEISFERGFSGRFGGDEFVLCLTNLTLYGDAGKIGQEIIDILGKGFNFSNEEFNLHMVVRCSIGIAFLRESGKTTEEVIAAADEAMYNIKKHGKSAYAYAKAGTVSSEPVTIESVFESSSAIDSYGGQQPAKASDEKDDTLAESISE